MPGQAPSRWRRRALIATFSILILLPAVAGGAGASRSEGSLRAQAARLAHEKRSAVLSLYALDRQVGAASGRLATLQTRARQLRDERVALARQLALARRGERKAQSELASELRTLYEAGDVEPLEILFGANTLDEALTSLDDLSRSTKEQETVVAQVVQARKRTTGALASLSAREAELLAASHAAEATLVSLTQARDSRAALITSLSIQSRMTQQRLATVVARARAAAQRSARLQAQTKPALVPMSARPTTAAPIATDGSATALHRLTVVATGYSMGGSTATGLPVGWGVAAVDPSVIPLGTHFTVPGYGSAVAADVGSGVVGASIDLWFPTIADARAWGRRVVTIVIG